jgi:hypothetical protein
MIREHLPIFAGIYALGIGVGLRAGCILKLPRSRGLYLCNLKVRRGTKEKMKGQEGRGDI